MMLRRSEALPDLRERKRFAGPLDIRAPEDHAVVEQQKAPAAPIWSPAIKRALGDFGTAMRSGVVDEMKRAARDVVDATSAYYRISGVPTFAHDPVPWQLIEHALPIEELAPGEHTERAVGRFIDVFDDAVKPMLRGQMMRHLERGKAVDQYVTDDERIAYNRNPLVARSLIQGADESRAQDSTRQGSRAGIRATTLENALEREDRPRQFREMLYGRSPEGSPDTATNLQYGTPAGAKGLLDDDIEESEEVDVLSPASRDDRFGPPWYTPGDWRKARDPRTAGGTRLIGPERLTPTQRKNLAERNWIFPTDGDPEYGPVGLNYPFFGARRREGGPSTFHGGYDARFRKAQPGSGNAANKQVVAATRARFKKFTRYAKDGVTVINKITFDLGDGMELEMLHVEPTPEIMAMERQLQAEEARANAARSAGRPIPTVKYPEVDAGYPLGEVDWPPAQPGKKRPPPHDHTHMQLITTVDGVRSTVDITDYMERRARRFWRHPTNDWLEGRYDDIFGANLPAPLTR